MARRQVEHRGYWITKLGTEACATWLDGDKRRRFRLGIPIRSPIPVLEQALIAFAASHNATSAPAGELTIDELAGQFFQELEDLGHQADSQRYHWKATAVFFGALFQSEVTIESCRRYCRARFEEGRATATVWTEMRILRTILNWGVKRRRIVTPTFELWMPPKGKPRDRVLTLDEVWRLVDACRAPHLRLFTLLCLCTGGRSGAVLDLQWKSIDFERGVVDLRSTEVIDPMSSGYRKGRGVVPMNNLLRAALLGAKENARTDFVIEWSGRAVTNVGRAFRRAVGAAGLPGKVSPHTLRHTTATMMIDADVPIEDVARYLGHAGPDVTRRVYAHPEAEGLRGAAGVMELGNEPRLRIVK